MALGQLDDVLAADWVRLRELRMTGKIGQAFQLAEQMAAESPDPVEVAQALIAQLAVHHATKNQGALLPLLERIDVQLRAAPPSSAGRRVSHLRSRIAYDRHSYGLALRHVVEAQRALQQMGERTLAAVNAWTDLASISTALGYHAGRWKRPIGASLCALTPGCRRRRADQLVPRVG